MKIATVGLGTDNYEATIDPLHSNELIQEVLKFLEKDFGERHKNPQFRELKESILYQKWEDWHGYLFVIETKQFPVSCSVKMRQKSPNEETFFIKFLIPNGTEIGKVLIKFSLENS